MDIYFMPISMFVDPIYTLEVADNGSTIILNDAAYSVAALADEAAADEPQLPQFVVGATASSVKLLLPYWGSAPPEVLYPAPMLNVPDGPVVLPGQ